MLAQEPKKTTEIKALITEQKAQAYDIGISHSS